jgi:hypothetical protein
VPLPLRASFWRPHSFHGRPAPMAPDFGRAAFRSAALERVGKVAAEALRVNVKQSDSRGWGKQGTQ